MVKWNFDYFTHGIVGVKHGNTSTVSYILHVLTRNPIQSSSRGLKAIEKLVRRRNLLVINFNVINFFVRSTTQFNDNSELINCRLKTLREHIPVCWTLYSKNKKNFDNIHFNIILTNQIVKTTSIYNHIATSYLFSSNSKSYNNFFTEN